MLINFEEFAEEYCIGLEYNVLKNIINEGADLDDLENILKSEFPEEEFSNDDIYELNNHIVNYAGYTLNEYKQTAAQELRRTLDNTLGYECSVLEDYEIAGILAEYVSQYLRIDL